MVVDTKNRGGRTLNKGFTVYTNDTTKPQVKLVVKGKVRQYVTLTPGFIKFFGAKGSEFQQTIQIVPMEGFSFSITEVKASQDKFIRYKLKPMDKSSGKKGYTLLVENTKKEPGNYRDTIVIKTDSKKIPMMRIPVYGRIQKLSQNSGQKQN